MTDTTDKLVEQIKADRKAGTTGKWSYYKKGRLNRVEAVRAHGSVCVAGIHKIGSKGGSVDGCFEANARRIARVPDMEARILSDAETIKAAKDVFRDFQSLENCRESEAHEVYGALQNSMRLLGAALTAERDALAAEVKRLRGELTYKDAMLDAYEEAAAPLAKGVLKKRLAERRAALEEGKDG